MTRICHLVDDTSPGGVTRFLEYMRASKEVSALGDHIVVPVHAGFSKPPRPNVDVIVSHVVLSWKNLPFFLALRAANASTPMIHMEHSYSPAFEKLQVTSTRRFRAMLGVSLSLFDSVITICTAQRQWLAEAIGVPDAKLCLIPPCVDLSDYLGLAPVDGPITSIGAFGRFDTQKGFDVLIPAFRKADLAGVRLDIFGDGPQREELEALAGGDPSIVFHGFTDDPCAAMATVDAVAMPSRREPYGLVAVETLAAGRALLVSRVDGLIDHALNGAIPVERLTVEDWSRALRNLSASTDAARRSHARQLAARAEAKFVQGWDGLLKDLTN